MASGGWHRLIAPPDLSPYPGGGYAISTLTQPYHAGYGGPEIDQHQPKVKSVSLAQDGLSAKLVLEKLDPGFVYELDLVRLRSRDQEELLHRNAFYTVNEVPSRNTVP